MITIFFIRFGQRFSESPIMIARSGSAVHPPVKLCKLLRGLFLSALKAVLHLPVPDAVYVLKPSFQKSICNIHVPISSVCTISFLTCIFLSAFKKLCAIYRYWFLPFALFLFCGLFFSPSFKKLAARYTTSFLLFAQSLSLFAQFYMYITVSCSYRVHSIKPLLKDPCHLKWCSFFPNNTSPYEMAFTS